MTEQYKLDRPSALTCPECGGATTAESTGTLLQFRCHIGHVLTAEAMLAAQFTMVEAKLAASLVALKERAELCRQMSDVASAQGQDAASHETAGKEALERAGLIKRLLESEWIATARGSTGELRG